MDLRKMRWFGADVLTIMKEYRAALGVMLASVAVSALVLSGTSALAAREMREEAVQEAMAATWDRGGAPAVSARMVARQQRAALVAKVRDNWREPTGVQPDLSQYANISVEVSLADQMVYVKSGDDVIYEMVASTGIDDSTPHGTFVTNGDGGDHFYTARDRMGADYWTRITGVYLFHSVPTGVDEGDYLPDQAVKLGEPASHGCVRLTVADAKWVHEQLPKGTAVTIA